MDAHASAPPVAAPNFADHLTVKEAARFLGVSPSTLRNWDGSGRLRAKRHPLNGYRLYERPDLERLLRAIGSAAAGPSPAAERRPSTQNHRGRHEQHTREQP